MQRTSLHPEALHDFIRQSFKNTRRALINSTQGITEFIDNARWSSTQTVLLLHLKHSWSRMSIGLTGT